MTEQEYLYWLIHIQGIGPAACRKLYEYFGSFREIWKADERALSESKKLNEKQSEALLQEKRTLGDRAASLEALTRRGIQFIPFFDDGYPKRLREYLDRPPALFVKGVLPDDDRPTAAIVGARDCSEYGRWASESFGEILAAEGVQIISGLAVGIDQAAHLGALKAGAKTFGVLGCGITTCYPKENWDLYLKMVDQGGVLTEFVPGTRPSAGNFPRRNRIISGLSDAVIIAEAREKSGSLITADYALEQGKEIFVLPGRITDALSGGCNRLIQSGAAICLTPSDVLDYFAIKTEKKLTVRKISEKRLANHEKVLYSFLDSRPKHVEEIMVGCGLNLKECMEGLLRLELLGGIRSCGNQFYCRKL